MAACTISLDSQGPSMMLLDVLIQGCCNWRRLSIIPENILVHALVVTQVADNPGRDIWQSLCHHPRLLNMLQRQKKPGTTWSGTQQVCLEPAYMI